MEFNKQTIRYLLPFLLLVIFATISLVRGCGSKRISFEDYERLKSYERDYGQLVEQRNLESILYAEVDSVLADIFWEVLVSDSAEERIFAGEITAKKGIEIIDNVLYSYSKIDSLSDELIDNERMKKRVQSLLKLIEELQAEVEAKEAQLLFLRQEMARMGDRKVIPRQIVDPEKFGEELASIMKEITEKANGEVLLAQAEVKKYKKQVKALNDQKKESEKNNRALMQKVDNLLKKSQKDKAEKDSLVNLSLKISSDLDKALKQPDTDKCSMIDNYLSKAAACPSPLIGKCSKIKRTYVQAAIQLAGTIAQKDNCKYSADEIKLEYKECLKGGSSLGP